MREPDHDDEDNNNHNQHSDDSEGSSSYAGSANSADSPLAAKAGQLPWPNAEDIAQSLIQSLQCLALDKVVSIQSKSSGLLNARSHTLDALVMEAEGVLNELKTTQDFKDLPKLVKELQRDLSEVEKRIQTCKAKAMRQFPVEYCQVRDSIEQDESEV